MGIFRKCEIMTRLFLTLFIAALSTLSSESVKLFNDSPYQLRAVVRGGDGSYLGELVIASNTFNSWTDSNTQFGIYDRQRRESVTPYTVMWYCMDGSDFSICTNVPNGGLVTAQTCDGARECGPRKQPKSPNPNHGQGEELYVPPQAEQKEGETWLAPP
jgi:hypothetical protein